MLPPIAGFSCDTLLADSSQFFENVNWSEVYHALVERVRTDLIQTRERVCNALTLGRVRVCSQSVQPNQDYYQQQQYIQDPELSNLAKDFSEYLVDQVQRQCQQQGVHMTSSLGAASPKLAKTLFRHWETSQLVTDLREVRL